MRAFFIGGNMKKLFTLLLVLVSIFCCGCTENKYTNISFRHTAYFVGKCAEFKLTVTCGERESPYIADGEVGDMVEFCMISLKPLQKEATGKSYTYMLSVDGEEYKGLLSKDIFGTGYNKDVGVDIGQKLSSITISDGEKSYPIELENMMSNAIISESEAIDISVNEFSSKLKEIESEGRNSEIYLKFVCDSTGDESFYYWYVAHVMQNGEYASVLLDIVSGDVIAKRGG